MILFEYSLVFSYSFSNFLFLDFQKIVYFFISMTADYFKKVFNFALRIF